MINWRAFPSTLFFPLFFSHLAADSPLPPPLLCVQGPIRGRKTTGRPNPKVLRHLPALFKVAVFETPLGGLREPSWPVSDNGNSLGPKPKVKKNLLLARFSLFPPPPLFCHHTEQIAKNERRLLSLLRRLPLCKNAKSSSSLSFWNLGGRPTFCVITTAAAAAFFSHQANNYAGRMGNINFALSSSASFRFPPLPIATERKKKKNEEDFCRGQFFLFSLFFSPSSSLPRREVGGAVCPLSPLLLLLLLLFYPRRTRAHLHAGKRSPIC